jgi:hypothetical protein
MPAKLVISLILPEIYVSSMRFLTSISEEILFSSKIKKLLPNLI